MLGPSKLVTTCTCAEGVVFYSEHGGHWKASDRWPSDISSVTSYRISPTLPTWVVVVCDDTPSTLQRLAPVTNPNAPTPLPPLINIKDFLAVVGCTTGMFVRTTLTSSRDEAARALAENYNLIMKYRRAGPYAETFLMPVPSEMVPNIDIVVADKLSKYTTDTEANQLAERLGGLQHYVIDLRSFSSSKWNRDKLLEICKSYDRKVFRDYILPQMRAPTHFLSTPVTPVQMRKYVFDVTKILAEGVHRIDLLEALALETEDPAQANLILDSVLEEITKPQ